MRFVVIGCLIVVALTTVACADGGVIPTGPSATAADSSLSASPRSGELHVTKECKDYDTGAFCTITSSNIPAIKAGWRIVYREPELIGTPEGSAVVLDGPGVNDALGNCSLFSNVCTFSGGTGKFAGFQAEVVVSYLGGFDFGWDGTYSFSPPGR